MVWESLKIVKKKHFVQAENLDEKLLLKLDALCQIINSPPHDLGHCPRESHLTGFSVDVIFPEFEGSLLGLYLIAERLNFTHIGLYPDWDMLGKGIGGLHLETSPLAHDESGSRWIGVDEYNYDKIEGEIPQKKTKFLGLTIRNLKRLKVMK